MVEHTQILGIENNLVATFTHAQAPNGDTPPVIALLTNSGVIPRSGPHRMNVHIANRLATQGIPSVRFDMSGLGDSGRTNSTLPIVEQWVADTRSVMDAAQARFGCARFMMVGFCSGAEVAYLTALEDPRLRAILLWDLYAYKTLQSQLRTFIYKLRRVGFVGAIHKARDKLISALRSAAVKDKQERGRAVKVALAPSREVFAQHIQTLTNADVELLFVFCGGEPEWFNHKGQFKAMFGRFPFYTKVAFQYLELSDHLITTHHAQVAFLDMMERWLRQRILKQ